MLHTHTINGKSCYVHRMLDHTVDSKADANRLILARAMHVANSGGWGLEKPAGAPERAVCECGVVFAKEPDRNKCWKCTASKRGKKRLELLDENPDAVACRFCGTAFVPIPCAVHHQTVCKKKACRTKMLAEHNAKKRENAAKRRAAKKLAG